MEPQADSSCGISNTVRKQERGTAALRNDNISILTRWVSLYLVLLVAVVQCVGGKPSETSGSFVAGKSFSLADVSVFPGVAYLFRFKLTEECYPKLTAYYNSLKERPSIKSSWPPTWLESPQGQDMLKDV